MKMARKPGKKHKEKPAECAGEGKQRKANIGVEKRTLDYAKLEFCYDITRRKCKEKGGKRVDSGKRNLRFQ